MLSGVNEDSCIDVINGDRPIAYFSIQGELDNNKVSILNKMYKSQNNVIKFVFDVCGKAELMSIL